MNSDNKNVCFANTMLCFSLWLDLKPAKDSLSFLIATLGGVPADISPKTDKTITPPESRNTKVIYFRSSIYYT